jgi:hypothetical protein
VSNASVIEAFGTKTTKFDLKSGKISYILEAKYLYKNYEEIKKRYNFFNRKVMAKRYDYLQNGCFLTEDMKLNFKKSYKYDGKLIFEKVNFTNNLDKIKARECSYKANTLTCKGVWYLKDGLVVKTKIKEIYKTRKM